MKASYYYLFALTIVLKDHYVNEEGEYWNEFLQLVQMREWNAGVAEVLWDIADDMANKKEWSYYMDIAEDIVYEECRKRLNELLSSKEKNNE